MPRPSQGLAPEGQSACQGETPWPSRVTGLTEIKNNVKHLKERRVKIFIIFITYKKLKVNF
jgi:hypothetical protein